MNHIATSSHRILDRSIYPLLFVLVLSLASFAEAQTSARRAPNVVILLTDDLGYGDLGAYGNTVIKTPNLDRLASQGLRLTNFYSAAPVCSPSRAALMTGRIPQREGILDWIPFDSPVHLRRDAPTIATLLKQNGYATALVGKWHLNGKFDGSQSTPTDHGFDYWLATGGYPTPSQYNPDNFFRNGVKVGVMTGYSSTIIADDAIAWLKRRKTEQPFFLFVSFHAPHEDIASAERYVKMYEGAYERNRALYYANVTEMDFEVGRVLQALGEDDNTFVFFSSDNGPEVAGRKPFTARSYGVTGGLRGMKLDLYEGGIRVPAMIRWPGVVRPGQRSDALSWMADLLPTICELAAIRPPAGLTLDGISIEPLLRGKTFRRKTPLYWQYDNAHTSEPNDLPVPKLALRNGEWKLLSHAGFKNFELYNLKTDPAEKINLAEKEPARLQSLLRDLQRRHQVLNGTSAR